LSDCTMEAHVTLLSNSTFTQAAIVSIFFLSVCFFPVGCATGVPSIATSSTPQLRGMVHGGSQPISGAVIQLYAAGTTGYGTGATALLNTPVTTDANGTFSITGDYTCPSSTSQLYLVATGGNPGLTPPSTNNAAIVLMTALGPCTLYGSQSTLNPNSFIFMNEATTVASVYALAPFMTYGTTQVGASSTNSLGLANAFLTVPNLVNTSTGTPLTTTPAGNGTSPRPSSTLSPTSSPPASTQPERPPPAPPSSPQPRPPAELHPLTPSRPSTTSPRTPLRRLPRSTLSPLQPPPSNPL
jgi:hypothetical protein